jgi:hypothetical protein
MSPGAGRKALPARPILAEANQPLRVDPRFGLTKKGETMDWHGIAHLIITVIRSVGLV